MNDAPGSTWLHLDSGPGEAAFNMALDEALLEAAQRVGKPILRFYGWTEPAASFGYSQRHAEVAALTPLRPLVRRCTGGGIVPHDADWTYSLCFPPGHWWYELPAIESYRRVHEWVRAAFAAMGQDTMVAPIAAKSLPGQCFAGHEQYDLLWRGRKIAGAAQRRAKWGLLIQGSLQSPVKCPRSAWHRAMLESAATGFFVSWAELHLDDPLRERAQTLARAKYSQDAYNLKR